VVVAVAEDSGGYGDAVAEEATRRGAAAVDLGLDVFDDDALTAFGRFHLVPIIKVHSIVIGSSYVQEAYLLDRVAGSILPKNRPHLTRKSSPSRLSTMRSMMWRNRSCNAP
jgi:hypothetical protein